MAIKNFLFSFVLLTIAACNSKKDRVVQNLHEDLKIENIILKKADSLGVKDLFYESKWRAYCFCPDQIVRWLRVVNIDNEITTSALDIYVSSLEQRNDTIAFKFCYAYYPIFVCDSLPIGNMCFLNEIGFSKYKKNVLYYSDRSNYSYSTNDPTSRFYNPLQPKIIEFIRNNENKLNNWFKNEAKRRRVIE